MFKSRKRLLDGFPNRVAYLQILRYNPALYFFINISVRVTVTVSVSFHLISVNVLSIYIACS